MFAAFGGEKAGDGMKKIFLFSGIAVLSGSIYWFGPLQKIDPFPDQREFQILYKAAIAELPSTAESVRIWIPVASSREGQEILDRKIQSPMPYQITRDSVHGNEMAYFELKKPFPSSLDFNVNYKARMTKPAVEQTIEEPKDADLYLKRVIVNSCG